MIAVSEMMMCDEWREGYDDEEREWDWEYNEMLQAQDDYIAEYLDWLYNTEEGAYQMCLEHLNDVQVVKEFGMDLVHWHGEEEIRF